ncbi:hypothetical protein DSO57_1001074 [Entomophthora muscae]|uniref:Uncharacterized protein n=1 Tax=Entomophthora muscae TaxID=34485 RepID=A0ACC2RP34_9FUNG|nr:hypothetical protein DSO57_1001074 [Entomophthora muscae]
MGFTSLTFINILYNYSYFFLVDVAGAVSTGILQALRSVFVIAFSAIFFCENDANQCINAEKGSSALLVMLGVIIYNCKL